MNMAHRQSFLEQDLPVLLRAVDRVDVNDDRQIFELLADAVRSDVQGALVTLTTIIGGAPRSLGAHMAVLEDGRYCGYVSGGCVEAAIAREAIAMMADCNFGHIKIGAGSPWFDLRLPCGGGLVLLVQPAPPVCFVQEVLQRIAKRTDFSIVLAPTPRLDPDVCDTGWSDGEFHRRYIPDVQFAIIGGGREATTLDALVRALGLATMRLESSSSIDPRLIDARTACVFLDHDLDQMLAPLRDALATPALYIGAVGSKRTSERRAQALRDVGIDQSSIDRIHGPIGLTPRTRDSRSLAVSVLAEITAIAQSLGSAAL